MNFKKYCALTLLTSAALLSGQAQATVTAYSITTSGAWFDSQGNPFGMGFSPSLVGSITVDNTLSNMAAVTAFSITTGTKTWTLADFVGTSANTVSFDGAGNLNGFDFNPFQAGAGSMYIYLNNTMAVIDGLGNVNACNGCLRLGGGVPVVTAVPEPTSTALVLAGLGIVGWRARSRAKAMLAA